MENKLADIIFRVGQIFESLNPAIFRFLAALLPYLTPVPVATLTAASATEFLGFSKEVAFVLVFSLEGIGLWFTTLLVDSFVEAVRSRNWKSWGVVLMFLAVIFAYIRILIDLNVTIETALNTIHPALSRVITLLCYLPLIAGIGNGYYKLTLKRDTELVSNKKMQIELDEKKRQEQYAYKLERERIKRGVQTYASDTLQVKHAGDYKKYVMELLDKHGELPLTEITERVNKDKGTNFVHKDVKGTWYKFVKAWKR